VTKLSEILNVHHMIDGDQAITTERRKFMMAAGIAVLTVYCLPVIAQASENSPAGSKSTADNLIIQSGPGMFSHVHDLLIPYAVLQAPPPQGVKLTTTEAVFHRHDIALTREQLIVVNHGGTVTRKASSHLFVIALANGQHHR
jgi:hypothetical protein